MLKKMSSQAVEANVTFTNVLFTILNLSNYHRNPNQMCMPCTLSLYLNTSLFIPHLNQMLLISLSEALIYMAPATEIFRLRGGGCTGRGKEISLFYCWQQRKLWIRACDWQLVLFISMQECIKGHWQGQHCTTLIRNINSLSSYFQSKKKTILIVL